MIGRKRIPSLVNPRPLRGFRGKRIIYVPCDLPTGTLSLVLERTARGKRDLGFCRLYRFAGQSVIYGALGAAAGGLALETAIASGIKEVILLGFCGSLSRHFRIGDAVVVREALPDEGTSRHYLPRRRSFLPSPDLSRDLESSSKVLLSGVIISTDAPYRETAAWLKRSLQRGAELVDMETSAVFALAAFHGIKAASLQIVSDEIFSGRWKSGFSGALLETQVRTNFLPLLTKIGENG